MRIRKPFLPMLMVAAAVSGFAQGPRPLFPPQQLDESWFRGSCAFIHDPFTLAQILAAATYPDVLPDAAHWADEHHCAAPGRAGGRHHQ